MSAGSRKKHSNAHKGFQGGSDHLEVEALLAGAGNGRDVEEKLGDAVRINEDLKLKPEDVVSNGAESLTGVGNEGPVAAGNADVSNEARIDGAEDSAVVVTAADEKGGAEVVEEENNDYVSRDIRAVVVRSGNKFDKQLTDHIVDIIENQAKDVSGLVTGFSVGRITNTQTRTIARESQASFWVREQKGRVIDRTIHRLGDLYNDYQIDSERKLPASATKMAIEDVTIDVVFFETNPEGDTVIAAWHGMDLYVTEYSGLESKRHRRAHYHDTQTMNIVLAGRYVRNASTDKFAQSVLDKLRERGQAA